jgi:hypothetical protein
MRMGSHPFFAPLRDRSREKGKRKQLGTNCLVAAAR